MRHRIVSIAATVGLAGCSFGEDVPAVEKEIAAFHAQLDQGRFVQIYAASAPDMKNAAPQAEMVKLLQAVHTKLGRFRGGKTVGWNDNRDMSGHFVALNYAASYERGPAQENFVYRIGGGRATLVGYHISSNVFITG